MTDRPTTSTPNPSNMERKGGTPWGVFRRQKAPKSEGDYIIGRTNSARPSQGDLWWTVGTGWDKDAAEAVVANFNAYTDEHAGKPNGPKWRYRVSGPYPEQAS